MKHFLFFALFSLSALATPYPHPEELLPIPMTAKLNSNKAAKLTQELVGEKVLRVQIDWTEVGELYRVGKTIIENSGTQALLQKATQRDPWGSYIAELKIGDKTFFDSIGTGKEYRKLALSLSFRFPLVAAEKASIRLWAENPQSGVHEVVLDEEIKIAESETLVPAVVETKLLRDATDENPLVFTIYADGYGENRKARFFERAQKVVDALVRSNFPNQERFRILAVFAPSNTKIGSPQDLGKTPVKRDSFLGLYFPHWNKFGRWTDVVYPTDENHLRRAFATAPYDYPVALVDDGNYWGVGNYKMYTAIPAEASQFDFLFLHEFGHFLGLNEEYEESGRTELEFAPEIVEPWSYNMTFHPHRGELKWEHLVKPDTKLPTPASPWGTSTVVGAYVGGYAGSAPLGKNHKPVQTCTMHRGGGFCQVCSEGILIQLKKDAGTKP